MNKENLTLNIKSYRLLHYLKPKPTKGGNGIGYCIRTGEKINFTPDRPLSDSAYKSWSRYKDKDYKEKYCHYSGEPSNGETSFAKPILSKNWKKAKERQYRPANNACVSAFIPLSLQLNDPSLKICPFLRYLQVIQPCRKSC